MAQTPFLTDAELTTALVNVLRQTEGTLPPAWGEIIAASNQSAYLDIRGALLSRGFEASQIDQWARGREFNLDIGLYWCLVKGAGLHGYDDRWAERLDRRKELYAVLVELSTGTPQAPTGDPGGVSSGCIPVSAAERHRLRDFAGEGCPFYLPNYGIALGAPDYHAGGPL